MFGMCCYSKELIHRAPYLARGKYANCKAPFRQCLIAAPRAYCMLSHYPFFELHFHVSRGAARRARLAARRAALARFCAWAAAPPLPARRAAPGPSPPATPAARPRRCST